MNYTKEDIEYYLINKEYHELNADELGFISSEVKSEKEFNQLKKLMISLVEDKSNEAIIEPDPAIKTALMKEFSNKSKINKVWYNSLLIQLFPKEKSFYQMPGIQIAGVAASLLLVLNIFLTNDPINNENQVAVNNEPNTEEKSSSLELENELTGNSDSVILLDNLRADRIEVESTEEENIASVDLAKERELPDIPFDLAEETVDDVMIEEDWAGDSFELTIAENDFGADMDEMAEVVIVEEEVELISKDETNETFNETITLSGFTEPTINNEGVFTNTSVEEMEINKDMKSSETAKGRVRNKNTVIKSRSLDDDEELIALFFTAL